MKERYLCPVCDKELKGNFCTTCKKVVRSPMVYTGGALPNESGSYSINEGGSAPSYRTVDQAKPNVDKSQRKPNRYYPSPRQGERNTNQNTGQNTNRNRSYTSAQAGRPQQEGGQPRRRQTERKKSASYIAIIWFIIYILYFIFRRY